MTISQICICLAIAVYLIAMLGVGVWFSKRNNSVDDFYLGGRKLGPFVTAMSAEASDMSSWLLMGLPGVAYLSGLAEASWTAIGLAVGTYLNWLIVARRIRRYSHQIDAITVPQFFSKRWGDERNLLSAIAAVVIMIFFVPYLASGFSACGKLFASLFGINYVSAMLISAAVIVIYTVMGGFLAASFTDLVQSIIMTVALVVVITLASYAQLVVVNDKVVELRNELSELQSEETQLKAQYELAYDLQEIERQMLASGEMMKVQSWQTYTLELSEPDTVEYHQGSDLAQQIMSFAKNLVSAVKEYF